MAEMMSFIGPIIQGLGMWQSEIGAREAAAASRRAAEFQASQLEQNAGQEIAAGQRGAEEKQRQVALIQSKALAIAAASGGSASDPTVMNLIGRNAQLGSYESALAMYQGEEQARQNRLKAAAARATGQAQSAAYDTQGAAAQLKGIGNLLSSDAAKSLYAKYGSGGYDSSWSTGFGNGGTGGFSEDNLGSSVAFDASTGM